MRMQNVSEYMLVLALCLVDVVVTRSSKDSDAVKAFYSETETSAETQVSRQETSQDYRLVWCLVTCVSAMSLSLRIRLCRD